MITKKDVVIHPCGIECCGIRIIDPKGNMHDVIINIQKEIHIGCLYICKVGKKEIVAIQKLATKRIKKEHKESLGEYPSTQKERDKRIAYYMRAIKILVTEVRKNA